jgi:hypothetical protein
MNRELQVEGSACFIRVIGKSDVIWLEREMRSRGDVDL